MYVVKNNPFINFSPNKCPAQNQNQVAYPSRQFDLRAQRKVTEVAKNPVSPGMIGSFPNSAITTRNTLSVPLEAHTPNILLLTPAIFGSAAAFILGFGFFGHPLASGYNKYIFFMNVFALIASIGVGGYIYEARLNSATIEDVIFPALLLIFFFSTIYNLTYSLYPDSFTGTIGDTPLTQFFSFLSISIGAISVGETLNVTPEKPSTQILVAIEALFSLFALSLIIAIVSAK